MGLINLGGQLPFPSPPVGLAGAPTFGNLLTDAANEKVAFVFQAPKTGSIDSIGFRTSTVTTGGVNWDIRLETVDTSTGFPTGTLVGTNTNFSQAIASADDNKWFEVTLTAAASVTENEYYAVVISAPGSGSFSANFSYFADAYGGGFPCALLYTGSWALQTGGGPQFTVRYTDGTYPPISGVSPFMTMSTVTYNNTSTPDIYANKITLPFDCCVDGFWIWADLDGDYQINVYSSDGVTVLVSGVCTAAIPITSSPSFNYGRLFSGVTLSKNTEYILGVEPTTATSLSMYTLDFNNSGARHQIPHGSGVFLCSAKSPTGVASWTNNYSGILSCGFLINKISDGAAASTSAYTYGFMS